MKNIVVFASGGGSNFEYLRDAVASAKKILPELLEVGHIEKGEKQVILR